MKAFVDIEGCDLNTLSKVLKKYHKQLGVDRYHILIRDITPIEDATFKLADAICNKVFEDIDKHEWNFEHGRN